MSGSNTDPPISFVCYWTFEWIRAAIQNWSLLTLFIYIYIYKKKLSLYSICYLWHLITEDSPLQGSVLLTSLCYQLTLLLSSRATQSNTWAAWLSKQRYHRWHATLITHCLQVRWGPERALHFWLLLGLPWVQLRSTPKNQNIDTRHRRLLPEWSQKKRISQSKCKTCSNK